jgi:dihydrodipicolinate synthase/N-acetylneuraminate lyase
VPDALFVHYNVAKVGRLLAGSDYAALVDAVPALVGTKLTGGDVDLTIDCLLFAPTLHHFVVDGHMMPAAMFGASGIYSAIANLNPRWAAEWWAAAEAGDWAEVARRRILLAQFRTRWRAILAGVTSSPAIGHVFARCGILPEISLAVQPPYRPASVEQADAVAAVVRSEFPELIYRP